MREVVLLEDALNDLSDILDYVTRTSGSLTVGRRLVSDIRGRITYLASLPGTLGRDRSELIPNLRSAVHKNYVIFFRYRADLFEVVNILEGHRDLDAFFADDTA